MSRPDAAVGAELETRPVVAVVGRPNVGKSSLVNRIVGKRVAIVEERPGVTRDRKELVAEWNGRPFTLVDTGGWLGGADGLEAQVSAQAERAVRVADLVLLVVDVTIGVTDEDEAVASHLRRSGTPVVLVANKVDSSGRETDAWDFARLGLGDPWMVSALHGRGSGELLDEVVSRLPKDPAPERGWAPEQDVSVHSGTSVAIVGRPNVGKSTLFNRLIGDERSITHDLPGTTRDTVDTLVETDQGALRFIDTAGMRRKSRVGEGAEYYSLVRGLQAIDRSDVALLLIDATEGVTHQDQRLAERVDAAGSPIVLVLNKWDRLEPEARSALLADVGDRLAFLGYSPVIRASARTGLGVHRLLPALGQAIEAYHQRVSTTRLNRVVQSAQAAHPAPAGARVLYAVQGATDPPTFTLFTNRSLPPTYLRYIERKLREDLGFGPTPLKLRVRRRSR
ncbi:MAG: ribosome biogenesis GTPase Der [Actinobacteria bacterium]|nr:MAG: ribosome biogenesis GTPase Der [Actinomycetota bacterium]